MALSAKAQIQIGSNESSPNPGKIDKEDFESFKKTTTFFVLQEKDYAQEEAYREAIAKVWTVTPFKIVKPEDINTANKKQTSFFFFGGFMTVRRGQSTTSYHTHLSYDLFMLEKDKKGNPDKKLYAKIMLHPDADTYSETMRYAHSRDKVFSQKIIPYIYGKSELNNWSPVTLSGYLKVINDHLLQEETRSVFKETINKEALQVLKNDTLYIPDYVNIKFNMFTMGEKDTEEDAAELQAAYKYPVRYVSLKELNRLAVQNPNGIKYLSYIKSSTDKHVSVFDSKTGAMLYTVYVAVSYNFKHKDLRKLANYIK
ncbi:hypothetical protein DBR32_10380 [Taibaiella sp. KBW10]|nr:hypothetical protein DBR32_10380 [Taibaiella sp. KBW10]